MSSVMGTGVDWEKVRELTSDVHQEIPEKAHQLWDSVEAFQKVLLGQFPQKYINRVVACQIFFYYSKKNTRILLFYIHTGISFINIKI